MKTPKETTLLVVDDEADLRNAIAFDFTRKGYHVLTAENGADAFKIVESTPIDVVISDIRMPGGDGIELLNRVKEFNNRLPVVIFITGHADIGIEDAYDKGADVIFSKPFDRKALHAAVERAVTPKEKLWPARSERLEVAFSIVLKFPHLDTAIKAQGLSIGRGGMFVALDDRFPAVMSPVSFRLEFSDEPRFGAITGAGIVRWVRKTNEGGFRTGCGIGSPISTARVARSSFSSSKA